MGLADLFKEDEPKQKTPGVDYAERTAANAGDTNTAYQTASIQAGKRPFEMGIQPRANLKPKRQIKSSFADKFKVR